MLLYILPPEVSQEKRALALESIRKRKAKASEGSSLAKKPRDLPSGPSHSSPEVSTATHSHEHPQEIDRIVEVSNPSPSALGLLQLLYTLPSGLEITSETRLRNLDMDKYFGPLTLQSELSAEDAIGSRDGTRLENLCYLGKVFHALQAMGEPDGEVTRLEELLANEKK